MQYRKEIDGLRALAVLPVILFHAGLNIFKGGFIGVDVFFVISGYLITTIIISEKNAGTFSLTNFYERRIRRILPALYFVMIISFVFAWFWMLPSDMKDFSDTLLTIPIFASNILFWRDQIGYFNAPAQFKPFIHTWSLAVEEQYYLLFPLFIITTWQLSKRYLLVTLIFIAIVSFIFAEWGSHYKPVASFLNLPTRAWELLLGSCIAFYLVKYKYIKIGKLTGQFLSAVGLFLILYGIFKFSKNTPFPGVYALVPTIGAALIILFASHENLVGKFLGSLPMVSIGLISYSAYLWHQPLFAFARNRAMTLELNNQLLVALCISCLILAYITWRFVEKPFRNKKFIIRSKLFFIFGTFSAFFISLGAVGHISGFDGRYSLEEKKLLSSIEKENVIKLMRQQGGKCFVFNESLSDLFSTECLNSSTKLPRIIVIGDSHANHLITGFKYYFNNKGYSIDTLAMPGCAEIFSPKRASLCIDMYNLFTKKVLPNLKTSDLVVVSYSWTQFYLPPLEKDFISLIRKRLLELKNTKAKVIIIGASVSFTRAPQEIVIQKNIALNLDSFYLDTEDSVTVKRVNKILGADASKLGYYFFDPTLAMCENEDLKKCLAKKDGQYLYLDGGHLSDSGSKFVVNEFKKLLN